MGGPCDGGASTNIRSRIVRNIHMRCHCTPERPWRNVISRLLPCAAQHISVRGLRLTRSHVFEQFYHLAFACGRGRFASKRTAPVGLQTFTAAGRGGGCSCHSPHGTRARIPRNSHPEPSTAQGPLCGIPAHACGAPGHAMWRPGARVRPSAMICPSAAPREANAGPHESKTEPHEANAAPRKPGPGSHEPSPEPHENSRAVPKRRTFSFLR